MSFLLTFLRSQFFVTPTPPSQDWSGRVVIVTGSNSGIGLEAARHLVRLGASKLIMACRNASKAEEAKRWVEAETRCSLNTIEVWPLDMASYASVKAFAARSLKELPRVDALIENAGVSESKVFSKTEDNETSITINVMSTFLLALLILPQLRASASKPALGVARPASITIVTSELCHVAKFPERNTAMTGGIIDMLNNADSPNMGDRYMVSKLFQVYGIRALSKMLGTESTTPVVINTANPGVNDTPLLRGAWRKGLGAPEWVINLLVPRIARRPEVGAAAIVAGAEIGPRGHGQYLSDGIPAVNPPLVRGADGAKSQEAVWAEIVTRLEKIQPNIMKNV